MKKIKINVPSNLSDIKTSQYLKFIKVTKDLEDELTLKKYMVGIFCNIPDNVVNAMTKTSFDDVSKHINNILSQTEFDLKRVVKHDGVTYGFIPNLEELTVGEMADLSEYMKDETKLNKSMGVLYRPITVRNGDKYQIEDYIGGNDLDLPLDVTLGASFFLRNLMQDLVNYTQNFIAGEVQTNKKLQNLVENGGGINQFMDSLVVTFSNLKMLIN